MVVTLNSDQNCSESEPAALEVKTSPSLARMGAETNPHPEPGSKDGDERKTDAAAVAAPAVVDGLPPAVSHAPGRQASPPGGAPGAIPAPLGPAAVADHRVGHDLGGWRLAGRALRDRPRLLRRGTPHPQAARRHRGRIPESAGSRPDASTPRRGRGRASADPSPLRPSAAHRRLRADGLRWLADRVPPFRGVGRPPPAG